MDDDEPLKVCVQMYLGLAYMYIQGAPVFTQPQLDLFEEDAPIRW